jgi:hypothetical protein
MEVASSKISWRMLQRLPLLYSMVCLRYKILSPSVLQNLSLDILEMMNDECIYLVELNQMC